MGGLLAIGKRVSLYVVVFFLAAREAFRQFRIRRRNRRKLKSRETTIFYYVHNPKEGWLHDSGDMLYWETISRASPIHWKDCIEVFLREDPHLELYTIVEYQRLKEKQIRKAVFTEL